MSKPNNIHQRIYDRSYDSWIIGREIRYLRMGSFTNPEYLLIQLAAMRRHLQICIKASNKENKK
jgi:hypothetical protein